LQTFLAWVDNLIRVGDAVHQAAHQFTLGDLGNSDGDGRAGIKEGLAPVAVSQSLFLDEGRAEKEREREREREREKEENV